MAETVKSVAARCPPQFLKAFADDPARCPFADVCSGLLPGEEPVIRLRAPHAAAVVIQDDLFEVFRKLYSFFAAVLTVFRADRDEVPAEGDIPETEGDHFRHPQRTAIGQGKHKAVFEILRPHDQGSRFLLAGDPGERVVHSHGRQVPVGKVFAQDIAEIFLDGTVVDVDGPGFEFPSTIGGRAVQIRQEGAQLGNRCFVDRNAEGAVKPFAALGNGAQIGLDRPGAVVDQFKDVRHFPELFFIVLIVIDGHNVLLS